MPQDTAPQLMRSWLAVWAGVLALILSACGSRPAVQTPLAGGHDLCQDKTNVERLVVQQPANYPPQYLRFNVSVMNSAVAQQIAADVCALPIVPPGESFRCPKDYPITYAIQFIMLNGDVKTLEGDVTGCQEIWGRGFATRRALSPGFWRALGTAMGLRRPSYETFVGPRNDPHWHP